MRTQCALGSDGAAGHGRELLTDGRLPLREPVDGCLTALPKDTGPGDAARAREHQDTAEALVRRIGTAGQEGTRGRLAVSRARNGSGRNVRDEIQHPGYLLPNSVNGPADMDAAYVAPAGRGNSFSACFLAGQRTAGGTGGRAVLRISPSWTTDTTSSPSAVNNSPRASPRAPAVTGESCAYSSHRSARNGRWNHIA